MHHLTADLQQARRAVTTQLANIRRLGRLVLGDTLCQAPVGKRGMAGEQKIQRAAQAVDVGPGVHGVAVHSLLGRQVVRRAQHVFAVGPRQRTGLLVAEAGQPHVENLDHALGVNQQISRLDVAVDQPGVVRMLQPASGLGDVVSGYLVIQRLAALANQSLKIPALHILHHKVMRGTVMVDIVGPHDVRVIQRRCGLGLQVETIQERRGLQAALGQHLDGRRRPMWTCSAR